MLHTPPVPTRLPIPVRPGARRSSGVESGSARMLPETMLFDDSKNSTIWPAIGYHEETEVSAAIPGEASFVQHRASLHLRPSA